MLFPGSVFFALCSGNIEGPLCEGTNKQKHSQRIIIPTLVSRETGQRRNRGEEGVFSLHPVRKEKLFSRGGFLYCNLDILSHPEMHVFHFFNVFFGSTR